MANGDVHIEVRLNSFAVRNIVRGDDTLAGMRRIGQFGEKKAKEYAPVRTGNLRRSIYSETTQDPQGAVTRIGTNILYGIYQELGTIYHAAQPYLRPMLLAIQRALRTGRLQ